MKKIFKIILIIFVTYFTMNFIAKKTGILQVYKNPTLANEPNLKINIKFCVSNLVNPLIGDFVCYKYEDSLFGKQTRVHKLCGIENDILEIKNGIVFLNGTNIDENIEHLHFYKISKQEFEKIKKNEKLSEINQVFSIDENNIQISLQDLVAKKYKLNSKKQIEEKGKADKQIRKIFKNNWNKDNFGPIKIPTGKLFVIGDNRDNSEDSRFIGFIDKTNFIGTVVFNN